MTQNAAGNSEDFNATYLQLIKGANRILNTLSVVWKYSVSILLLSLSIVGAFSVVFYFIAPGHDLFLVEGAIFLVIAAWVFARNFLLGCNQCCIADIPAWKKTLVSFVKEDGTVDQERDGESVVENLMQVTDAASDWIRLIKRDVFSLLFWPIVAAVVFALSVYQVDASTVRLLSAVFAIYVGVLVVAVYTGVSIAFRKYQVRIAKFKSAAKTAMELL